MVEICKAVVTSSGKTKLNIKKTILDRFNTVKWDDSCDYLQFLLLLGRGYIYTVETNINLSAKREADMSDV